MLPREQFYVVDEAGYRHMAEIQRHQKQVRNLSGTTPITSLSEYFLSDGNRLTKIDESTFKHWRTGQLFAIAAS